MSAHGVVDLLVNGEIAHNETLMPGWFSYRSRHPYCILDITNSLKAGLNTIGLDMADGWWRGRFGFEGGHVNLFGTDQAALLHLDITCASGETLTVDTDETWSLWTSPRPRAALYDGETYDEREDDQEWLMGEGDPVHVTPVTETLVVNESRTIATVEEIVPVSVDERPDGSLLIDFGQNASGRIAFTANFACGESVTLKHAEILYDGELCTRPLREARSIDTFIGAGRGAREYTPRFTVHGFRYATIEGAVCRIQRDSIRMRVIRTPLELTSSLKTSSNLINKLHENIQWSLRSNFVGLPTDCPQRDERLGWTGDIQVFAPAALTLADSAPFLSDWLEDVAAEQREFGGIPLFVPTVPTNAPFDDTAATAVWDDVAVLLPWNLYWFTGERTYLDRHADLAFAWADELVGLLGDDGLWRAPMQLGDWLDPVAPPDAPNRGRTDPDLVANAYVVRSLTVAARIAHEMGCEDKAQAYRAVAERVRTAFMRAYVGEGARMVSHAQTAYSLAINTAILDGESRRQGGEHLAKIVAEDGYVIGTGFAGTPEVLDALTSTAHLDVAYRLLEQTECPSWLYPVTMGATTMWERWDSLRPDGSINPGGMTSFNHYAFGAVADWMYRTILGVTAIEPGFARIRIAPRPGGSLTHARGHIRTPHGDVVVNWRIGGGMLTLTGSTPTLTEVVVGGQVREVRGEFAVTAPWR
ncbi:family 78 glycoside hydrolase catalytic domain [Nanchangia anserum]|uniref:alpha-L-rhamnosidase n=1 Tax=Nanchangia anserum TaxID=2692125 RepID=A0A8I0GCT2_9ACTO|nr:family 78 glycoside hydrolase catalytic domain [Nanchangia anserum]QOX81960.1 family 78 glycoside hydrolase catalytic domain [Nanchangia anserum]